MNDHDWKTQNDKVNTLMRLKTLGPCSESVDHIHAERKCLEGTLCIACGKMLSRNSPITCGCGIATINCESKIVFCPLHANAEKLFKMLKTVHFEGAGRHYEAIADLLKECK